MENKLTRKKFLGTLAGTGTILLLNENSTAHALQSPDSSSITQPMHPYFPSQDPELVQEMVLVSHGQTEKVKELLAAHPELSKAAWDWGFGDWETAIGAASHTGSKEIAEMLMAHGARPDIFTFTMLGNLAAVKAMVEGNPGVEKIPGPHGITLLAHAKIRLMRSTSDAEKERAQAMIDYLTTLVTADAKAVSLDISDVEKKQFQGKFVFGDRPEDHFMVDMTDKGVLYIKKPGQRFERPLLRIEQNAFSPLGAPHVKILFDVKENQTKELSIHDPAPIINAVRQ